MLRAKKFLEGEIGVHQFFEQSGPPDQLFLALPFDSGSTFEGSGTAEQLSRGVIEDLEGIGAGTEIIRDFAGSLGRNLVLVMDGNSVVSENPNIQEIDHDDPDSLLRNNMFPLSRMSGQDDINRSSLIEKILDNARIAQGNDSPQHIMFRFLNFGSQQKAQKLARLIDQTSKTVENFEDLVEITLEGIKEWVDRNPSEFNAASFTFRNVSEALRKGVIKFGRSFKGEAEWIVKGSFTVPGDSRVFVIAPDLPDEIEQEIRETGSVELNDFEDHVWVRTTPGDRAQQLVDIFKRRLKKIEDNNLDELYNVSFVGNKEQILEAAA